MFSPFITHVGYLRSHSVVMIIGRYLAFTHTQVVMVTIINMPEIVSNNHVKSKQN